tara:strand:- start:15700 stop:15903 length:204 start_codon:yes stop_codon:yes gene_type:complete
MGIIKDNPSVVKTYQITIEQIKELIAKDLGIDPEEIHISDVQKNTTMHMDTYESYQFDGIQITHTPT